MFDEFIHQALLLDTCGLERRGCDALISSGACLPESKFLAAEVKGALQKPLSNVYLLKSDLGESSSSFGGREVRVCMKGKGEKCCMGDSKIDARLSAPS